MKLKINPFSVGLTSSVIALASNPEYQQNGGAGLLGALGIGVAAGLSYFIGSFIPNKIAAPRLKSAVAYKKLSDDANLPQKQNLYGTAYRYATRGGCWALVGGALGITAAVFGYKYANPEIKHLVTDKKSEQTKVVTFRSNFTPKENAAPYHIGTASYKIA